jgi:hypothetical protein
MYIALEFSLKSNSASSNLLRECLIPIINTTFIELSTTAYLFALFPSSYSKTQPLDSLDQERPKSKHRHCPSPIYRKTELPRHIATLLPTPQMEVHQCSDTSALGNRYSRVDRNEIPLGRCGLGVFLPIEKANRRITLQSVVVRIRIGSSVVKI